MAQLDFYERIAAWVAPGGTLLVVGHRDGEDHGHGHNQGRGDHPPAKAAVTAKEITAARSRRLGGAHGRGG